MPEEILFSPSRLIGKVTIQPSFEEPRTITEFVTVTPFNCSFTKTHTNYKTLYQTKTITKVPSPYTTTKFEIVPRTITLTNSATVYQTKTLTKVKPTTYTEVSTTTKFEIVPKTITLTSYVTVYQTKTLTKVMPTFYTAVSTETVTKTIYPPSYAYEYYWEDVTDEKY